MKQSGTFLPKCAVIPIVILSLALAAVFTFIAQRLPLEIVVDCDEQPSQTPAFGTRDASGGLRPLGVAEAIETAFAPHYYDFEVIVPEDGGAQTELFVGSKPEEMRYSPESSWVVPKSFPYAAFVSTTPPGTAEFSGWHLGDILKVYFSRGPWAGEAIIRSGEQSFRCDLHSAESIQVHETACLKVAVPMQKRRYRYYMKVPRGQMNHLLLDCGPRDPGIARVYVNTWIPRVYFSETAYGATASGLVHEHNSGMRRTEEGWFQFPRLGPLERGNWIAFIMVATASTFCLGLIWAFLRCMIRTVISGNRKLFSEGAEATGLPPLRWREFLFFWGFLLVCWGWFLLNFWPGTMNVDALAQWQQAQNCSFEAVHPPFYAMIFMALSRLWNSPAIVALLQVVTLSGLFAWGGTLLRRSGVSSRIVLVYFLVVALSPLNATMVISLIKDTPYAIISLLLVLCLFCVLEAPGRSNWGMWLVIGLSMGVLPLFRHNGLLVSAFLILSLPVIFYRIWHRAAFAGGIAIVTWVAIAFGLFSLFPIQHPSGGGGLAMGHAAIMLDRDVPMSNEDYRTLNEFRSIEDRWGYEKYRIDGTVLAQVIQVNRDEVRKNKSVLFQTYANLVIRNPYVAFKYFLERGEYLYVPWECSPMEAYFLGISRNNMGLMNYDLFLDSPKAIEEFLAFTTQKSMNWLFWRPALPLYLIMLAVTVLMIRKRNVLYAVLFLPLGMNTASLFVSAIAQNARYQLPVLMIAPLFAALVFFRAYPGLQEKKDT